MALPIKYSLRNVLVRWRSTLATVLGIGLVVFVFVLLQSLAAGIEKSSGNTGDPRNVMIVRKGATAESAQPHLARESQRDPLLRGDRAERAGRSRSSRPTCWRWSICRGATARRGQRAAARRDSARHGVATAGDTGGRTVVQARHARGRGVRQTGPAIRQLRHRADVSNRQRRRSP